MPILLHISSVPAILDQPLDAKTVLFIVLGALALVFILHRIRAKARLSRLDDPAGPWPAVSVIIPAHNEEAYIAQTIECVRGQDYPGELEIIAALNGCTDNTQSVAEEHGAKVEASDRKGISFGRNLGAKAATGEILIFLDADTIIPPYTIRRMVASVRGREKAIGAVGGRPDKGGLVVRASFLIANTWTRFSKISPPGPATLATRNVFEEIGGFDENLPQGTVTDFILRARKAGAVYVWVADAYAVTSIRRFEHTGVIRQMLEWRRNHKNLHAGERDEVSRRTYEDYR